MHKYQQTFLILYTLQIFTNSPNLPHKYPPTILILPHTRIVTKDLKNAYFPFVRKSLMHHARQRREMTNKHLLCTSISPTPSSLDCVAVFRFLVSSRLSVLSSLYSIFQTLNSLSAEPVINLVSFLTTTNQQTLKKVHNSDFISVPK